MSNLQDEISHLSDAEKFEVLDELWASLEAGGTALTVEQRAELEYRVSGYEHDPSNGIGWESLKANLSK
jgi:putative addiction module component (TIGR02574 family)